MLYTIYFDESGKLDKNIDSTYSYYAALIVSNDELEKINTELKEIKTKSMVKALTALKVEGKTLIIVPEKNTNGVMSARNIEGVKKITANNINVFDLLKYNNLILPVDTVKKLEEVYA